MKTTIIVFTNILIYANVQVNGDMPMTFRKEIGGLKKIPGFKGILPTKLTNAIISCGARVIVESSMSYPCFKTCLFREMSLDTSTDTDTSVDNGGIDSVIMDAFDMNVQGGRDSYWKLAKNTHVCADNYTSNPANKFALKYDDPAACEPADVFYKCCTAIVGDPTETDELG